MKHFHWMAALAAAALVLAGCGSMQEAGMQTQILRTALPADTLVATPENSTIAYWETETGVAEAGGFCFFVRPDESATDFVVYDPIQDGTQYVWTLFVVTKDGTHYLFPDPLVGDELETGGYDIVLGCKVPEVPEEREDPEWCSPGYWRQPHHLDSWEPTGYTAEDTYFEAFGTYPSVSRLGERRDAPTDPTLLEVLQHPQWYGGEAFNAVGDLLSAAHPDVSFDGERVEDSCPLD